MAEASNSTSDPNPNSPSSSSSFPSFFENWFLKLETLLQKLETLSGPTNGFNFQRRNHHQSECIETISEVVSHYQEFYQELSNAAKDDVFLTLCPPWLTSFELSLLWISGFKPTVLFPLLDRSVPGRDLSVEQKQEIKKLKTQTRWKEKRISEDMARVQETVAEPNVYVPARKFGRMKGGRDKKEMDAAMEEMKKAMIVVVKNADDLRGWMAGKLLDVLEPVQGVKLLAAAVRFQVRARRFGIEKDAERDRLMEANVAFEP